MSFWGRFHWSHDPTVLALKAVVSQPGQGPIPSDQLTER